MSEVPLYRPGGEREGVLEVLPDDLVELHDVQQHFAREPASNAF